MRTCPTIGSPAITERWEFGRWMLTFVPEGQKKLPTGFLDRLSDATGKGRSELKARRQLAENFASREALADVSANHKSWFEIVHKALPSENREPLATVEPGPLPEGTFRTIVADRLTELEGPDRDANKGTRTDLGKSFPKVESAGVRTREVVAPAVEMSHPTLAGHRATLRCPSDRSRVAAFIQSAPARLQSPGAGAGVTPKLSDTGRSLFARGVDSWMPPAERSQRWLTTR